MVFPFNSECRYIPTMVSIPGGKFQSDDSVKG